jgi:hypothetical protein
LKGFWSFVLRVLIGCSAATMAAICMTALKFRDYEVLIPFAAMGIACAYAAVFGLALTETEQKDVE